jgi:hypothetical protein
MCPCRGYQFGLDVAPKWWLRPQSEETPCRDVVGCANPEWHGQLWSVRLTVGAGCTAEPVAIGDDSLRR